MALTDLLQDKHFLIAAGLVAGAGLIFAKKNNPSVSTSGVTAKTTPDTIYIPTTHEEIQYVAGNQSIDNSTHTGTIQGTSQAYDYSQFNNSANQILSGVAQSDRQNLYMEAFNNDPSKVPAEEMQAYQNLRSQFDAEIVRKAKEGVPLSNSSSAYNNNLYQQALQGTLK